MSTEKNNKEVNWFVRIALILLSTLLFTMIIFKFFYNDPISEISTGLIILIAFLLILALSESFDNFSIGKVISLSKEVKRKEEKITKVETEKKELLNQIISLTNNINQRQSNTNIYGLPSDFNKQFKVEKVSEDEKEEIDEEVDNTEITISKKRRLDNKKIEEFVINRYVEENNVDVSQIYREVRLKAFDGIDPISDSSPIYDCYAKELNREVFLEIKTTRYISPLLTDRLYKMLSKIHHYREVKNIKAVLILVLVDVPQLETGSSFDGLRYSNRIWDDFAPALNSGLLKIKKIKIEKEEAELYYK